MKTSVKGRAFIWCRELCVLQAYDDGVGVMTIGVGHTAAAGRPVPRRGLTITLEEASDLFAKDLGKYEKAVNDAVKVSVNQAQFDAMVSLCFNIGPGAFKRSSVLRHLNKGDYGRAAASFGLWNKAKGKVLRGLVKRRKAETQIFVNGNYGPVKRVPVRDTKRSRTSMVPMPGLSDHKQEITILPEPKPVRPELEDDLKRSRTVAGAGTAGAAGAGMTVDAAIDAANEVQNGLEHVSMGTWVSVAIGLAVIVGAGLALYARWDDAGRPSLGEIFS